jgi:aspartyl-tRNA(Asn)/glutamyl-tRNA(Gln) amidotransferase subunit C
MPTTRRPGPTCRSPARRRGSRLRLMAVEIDIDHVARLARVALTDDEKAQLRDQLSLILEHAAKVGEVAAADVPPTAYAIPRANVYREDTPEPSLPQAEALANAPEQEDGRFKVVRILEAQG